MDPIAIATLTGPVLAAGIEFACSRISAALDRRAAIRLHDDEKRFVEGKPESLTPDELALTSDRVERLRRSASILQVYAEHPEIIKTDDLKLAQAITDAYTDLSAVYGVRFQLSNERPGVRVDQRLGDVARPVTGIKAGRVTKEANIEVSQTAMTVSSDGALIGLEINGTIG